MSDRVARIRELEAEADQLEGDAPIEDELRNAVTQFGSACNPPAVRAQVHTPPKLAADQDILASFASALRVCGLVGEDRNAKLVYLAITSRLLAEPVSLAAKGVSSVGKSFTSRPR